MSKYMEIKTEFKNGESLVKALDDLGIPYEKGANLKSNTVTMPRVWGNAERQVAINVTREAARDKKIGYWGGIGFKWNGAGYDLIQDDSDTQHTTNQMNALKQRYAYHEVKARVPRGYTVREQVGAGGEITLTLRRL